MFAVYCDYREKVMGTWQKYLRLYPRSVYKENIYLKFLTHFKKKISKIQVTTANLGTLQIRSDIQKERIWVVVISPGKAPSHLEKWSDADDIYISKTIGNIPQHSGKGGASTAYPTWAQRSLLCCLEVSSPASSVVLIPFPCSQINRNICMIFLIKLLRLYSCHNWQYILISIL